MLEVPVYNTAGNQVDTLQVDEALFGGDVNVALLKQAIVAYQANRRLGAASTRSRGEVKGSTRKLYRQKGTGYARRGQIRTGIMRGGGVAFAKDPRTFRKKLPRKMRRAALRSALSVKAADTQIVLLDEFDMEQPKTREFEVILQRLDQRQAGQLA